MRLISARAILSAVVIAMAVAAGAQEGHPLTGTWYGEYGTASDKRDLTVIMKWDGRTVTGTINPGPNATPLKTAVLDITPGKPAPEGRDSTEGTPPVFHVRLEGDLPNAAGKPERVVFEGTLENPVAGNRSVAGTWTQGAARGAFRIQRL